MKVFVSGLAALLLLFAGCGDPSPVLIDATVRFRVEGAEGGEAAVVDRVVTTVVAVEKPGRTSVVDAWAEDAPPGTIYGRHRFPPGTSASAMAAYYDGLLSNAGWTEDDVHVDRDTATIRLLGVTRIASRSDSDAAQVTVERSPTR